MSYVPVTLLKSVNFGRGSGNLVSVGYTLFNDGGETYQERTTEGIHEVGINTGIYAVKITFQPEMPLGSILWDTGTEPNLYATEQYNVDENNGNLLDWTSGRWSIEPQYKMMVFYAQDNICAIARFGLYDRDGNPSLDEVYTRIRNDESIIVDGIPGPHLKLTSGEDVEPATYIPYTQQELLGLMTGD